jgi:hypothetical protein
MKARAKYKGNQEESKQEPEVEDEEEDEVLDDVEITKRVSDFIKQ